MTKLSRAGKIKKNRRKVRDSARGEPVKERKNQRRLKGIMQVRIIWTV
jgi:hypothetical protein